METSDWCQKMQKGGSSSDLPRMTTSKKNNKLESSSITVMAYSGGSPARS